MWLLKDCSDLLWISKEEVLLFISSATQHHCYKTENTWPLEYDFYIWFFKWAEFGELWIWGQLHRKSRDNMQTSDVDIQILFDLINNFSLQFFFFIWKVALILTARNRLIFPYWLCNIWMPKCWLCTWRWSSWLMYLNCNLYIAVLKCKNLKNLWITFSIHKLSIKW